jgi:hypothetical protein
MNDNWRCQSPRLNACETNVVIVRAAFEGLGFLGSAFEAAFEAVPSFEVVDAACQSSLEVADVSVELLTPYIEVVDAALDVVDAVVDFVDAAGQVFASFAQQGQRFCYRTIEVVLKQQTAYERT